MCKGGGTNTVVQNSAPPAQMMQAYQQGVGYAQQAASAPYQYYPGNFVAGMSPDQQQAIATVANSQGIVNPYINAGESSLSAGQNAAAGYTNAAGQAIGSGAGTAAGYLNNAGQMVAQTAGAANPFINAGASAVGAAEQPISAQAITNYESPYQQQVVNATLGEIQQNNAVQQAQLQGNAASQGALGGDRQALAAATLANQQNLATNQTIASLNNQNYAQALSAAQQDAQRQLQAGFEYGNLGETATNTGLATAQAESGLSNQALGIGSTAASEYGNLGQYALGIGSTGAQNQLALGEGAQNAELQGAAAQFGMGTAEQQQQQNILNAAYQQWLGAKEYPFQTSQYYANIAEGLGSNMGGSSSTQYPSPSSLSQVAGLGMGALGLAGSLGAFGGGAGAAAAGAGAGAAAMTAADAFAGAGTAATAADAAGALAAFAKDGGRIKRADGGQTPYGNTSQSANGAGQPIASQSYVPSVEPVGIGKGPPPPPQQAPPNNSVNPVSAFSGGADVGKTIEGWIHPPSSDASPWSGAGQKRGGRVPLGYANGGVTSEEAGILGAEMSGAAQPQATWAARPTAADTIGDEQIIYQMMHPQNHARGGVAHLASGGSSGSDLPANIPVVSTALRTPAGMSAHGSPLGSVPQMAATQAVGVQPQMGMPLGQASQMMQSFGAGVPQLGGASAPARTGAEYAAGPTDFQTYMQQIRAAAPQYANPVSAPAQPSSQDIANQVAQMLQGKLGQQDQPAYRDNNPNEGYGGVGHARGGRTLADGGTPNADPDPGSVGDYGNSPLGDMDVGPFSVTDTDAAPVMLDKASVGTKEPPRLEPQADPDAPPVVVNGKGASVVPTTDDFTSPKGAPVAATSLGSQPLPEPPIPPAGGAPQAAQAPLGAVPALPAGHVAPSNGAAQPSGDNFSTIRPIPDQYQGAVAEAAKKWNVPAPVLAWTLGQESSWNPNAVNLQTGVVGLGQFKSDTAKQYGIDPHNPQASIDAAAHYLHDLYGKTGSWMGAVNGYGTFSTGYGPAADAAVKRGFQIAMGHAGIDAGTQTAQSGQEMYDVPPGGRTLGQPDWMPQQYPQIAEGANQALQPLGQAQEPPTTPLEKMAESPWMALAQAGFQMMAGTSPFAGVNIGRGLAAGTEYMQHEGQLQRERQALQFNAAQQNIERVTQQREQGLQGGQNLLGAENNGISAAQTVPALQGAGITANSIPGVQRPPNLFPQAGTSGVPNSGVAPVPPFEGRVSPQGSAAPQNDPLVRTSTGQAVPLSQAIALESRMSNANGPAGDAARQWLQTNATERANNRLTLADGTVTPYPGALSTSATITGSAGQVKNVSDQVAALQTDAVGAQSVDQNISEMIDAAERATPNPGASLDQGVAKTVLGIAHQLGLPVASDMADYQSNADLIHKLNVQLASQAQRLAGDRAYAALVAMSGATPSMNLSSKQSFDMLGRSLAQFAQLKLDMADYAAKNAVSYAEQNPRSPWGWMQEFRASHPAEMYASRVQPIQLKPGKNGQPMPPAGGLKSGYDYTFNGRTGQWNGQGWSEVDQFGNGGGS